MISTMLYAVDDGPGYMTSTCISQTNTYHHRLLICYYFN